jgi:hypothetical protein
VIETRHIEVLSTRIICLCHVAWHVPALCRSVIGCIRVDRWLMNS